MDILWRMKWKVQNKARSLCGRVFGAKSPGIDGILVTVGLCIIALLLCVVMRKQLSDFIVSLVGTMQQKATNMLDGAVIP